MTQCKKLCQEGRVALKSFLTLSLLFALLFLLPITINDWIIYKLSPILNPILFYLFINLCVWVAFKDINYQIAVRAAFLAQVFVTGIYVCQHLPTLRIFGLYMIVLAFFHYSEYITIAYIKPEELNIKSFLLSHSPAYGIALAVSWLEFFLEYYFANGIKCVPYVPYIGLIICIIGEVIRKVAMLTASSNFDHLVQFSKAPEHQLITHGIYGVCRHPSYVGWFYWSIATQILLLNPVCTIAYAIVSWKFFNERVYCEEITLLNFFGEQYETYQKRVCTGLPFIKGYSKED